MGPERERLLRALDEYICHAAGEVRIEPAVEDGTMRAASTHGIEHVAPPNGKINMDPYEDVGPGCQAEQSKAWKKATWTKARPKGALGDRGRAARFESTDMRTTRSYLFATRMATLIRAASAGKFGSTRPNCQTFIKQVKSMA